MNKKTKTKKKPGFKRPNWDELIPEAKSDFRCGDCDKMNPWQRQWELTGLEHDRVSKPDICTTCKNKREAKEKQKSALTRLDDEDVCFGCGKRVSPGTKLAYWPYQKNLRRKIKNCALVNVCLKCDKKIKKAGVKRVETACDMGILEMIFDWRN